MRKLKGGIFLGASGTVESIIRVNLSLLVPSKCINANLDRDLSTVA